MSCLITCIWRITAFHCCWITQANKNIRKMDASTWCLWRDRVNTAFYSFMPQWSQRNPSPWKWWKNKWWKQSMYDDSGWLMRNCKVFLCCLHFAKVTLVWASIIRLKVWNCCLWLGRSCASAPEILKYGWFASYPERVCVHSTALHEPLTSGSIMNSA